MKTNEITLLLEKYFSGETSLTEERVLKAYFQQRNIPESLQEFQPLFSFFKQEQQQSVDRDLVPEGLVEYEPQPTILFLRKWIPRVAATILTVLSLWTLYPDQTASQQAEVDWSKYEPATPEEAFRITHKALMKTSMGLHEGTSQAVKEVAKVKEIWSLFK